MRETTYALPETKVPPHSSYNVCIQTPYQLGPFRPRRLLVPSDVAPHFLVTDVKVGGNSQIACPAAIPASFFDEAKPPLDLYFDLLPQNRCFTVSVTNISYDEKTFRCSVAGVHDPSRINRDGRDIVMGLGATLAKPEIPQILLRVQPQVILSPHHLFVPEEVLDNFRVDSLGLQRAFLEPLEPGNAYATPDSSPDLPTHTDANPSQLSREALLKDGSIALPITGPNDFVKIVASLTSGRPAFFYGVLVGTWHL